MHVTDTSFLLSGARFWRGKKRLTPQEIGPVTIAEMREAYFARRARQAAAAADFARENSALARQDAELERQAYAARIARKNRAQEASLEWDFAQRNALRTRKSIKEIQFAVCEHFKVSWLEMMSDRRAVKIVRPRQVAMYLCSKLTTHSLPVIARSFLRDHTTVLHALRKLEAVADADPDIEALLLKLQPLKEEEPDQY